MSKRFVAGAPFDNNNLFLRPALDAGYIKRDINLPIQGIDGGDFNGQPPITPLHDGGTIPIAGFASFNPAITYGPNDIIEVPDDN